MNTSITAISGSFSCCNAASAHEMVIFRSPTKSQGTREQRRTVSPQWQEEIDELTGEAERHQLRHGQNLNGCAKRVPKIDPDQAPRAKTQQEVVQMPVANADYVRLQRVNGGTRNK